MTAKDDMREAFAAMLNRVDYLLSLQAGYEGWPERFTAGSIHVAKDGCQASITDHLTGEGYVLTITPPGELILPDEEEWLVKLRAARKYREENSS